MKRERKTETGREKEHMSESGNTAPQPWAIPVMKSVTVTVNTKSVVMIGTVTGRVVKKRKDTEKGDTGRKKRVVISRHAAATAEGGMTAKKAMATGNTNTKRARGAKRAKVAARRWA